MFEEIKRRLIEQKPAHFQALFDAHWQLSLHAQLTNLFIFIGGGGGRGIKEYFVANAEQSVDNAAMTVM